MAIGLLLLRVVVGLALAGHGAQKLFGLFGGAGMHGTAAFMNMLGFRPGRRHAEIAATLEVACGFGLAYGLLTPFAAAGTIGLMVVAAVAAHKRAFFQTNGGVELTAFYGAAAACLAFTGPGTISLDALLDLDLAGPLWGILAVVAGVGAGAAQLATRKPTTVDLRDAEPVIDQATTATSRASSPPESRTQSRPSPFAR